MTEASGETRRLDLFDIIDVGKLNTLDKAVYDAAKTYASRLDAHITGMKISGALTLRVFGSDRRSYFAFSGYQGGIYFGVLVRTPHHDMLKLATDKDYLTLVAGAAKHSSVMASIPLDWVSARHGNQGLYNEAKQFEIEPPCLALSGYCIPEEITDIVDHLAECHRILEEFEINMARR